MISGGAFDRAAREYLHAVRQPSGDPAGATVRQLGRSQIVENP